MIMKGDGDHSSSEIRTGRSRNEQEEENIRYIIRQSFLNAQSPQILGEKEQAGTVNYLQGSNESEWVQGVKTYAKIRYQELYAGIDLVYSGEEGDLKYDYVIAPGVDYQQIQVQFQG